MRRIQNDVPDVKSKGLQSLSAVSHFQAGDAGVSRLRVWPFLGLSVVIFTVLAARLFQLTVVEGAYYRERAENNRVFRIRRAAERGVFLDRNGEAMVANVPAYKRQLPGTLLAAGEFEQISRDEALMMKTQGVERVFFDIEREYQCLEACAVLFGYLGEVDEEDLYSLEGDYILGDVIGTTGLEKVFEWELRGTPGSELVEVDAQGELIRTIGEQTAEAGMDLSLTIDSRLQQLAYALLEGREGAVVAQVPQTGEVLALVSSPGYDPTRVEAFLQAEDQPFFNRAFAGEYPPGSVFKPVTAVAGLEEAAITAETEIEDTGELTVGEYRYGNWYYDEYGRTEGQVDVVQGLQRSNDIFFYKVGEFLGADKLADWAEDMGFGNSVSVSGLASAEGTVPRPLWKERTKGERWFLGNTYHMAIGQGDVLVTPLQINRMMGMLAADGVLCPPLLLQREVGREGCQQLNLHAETLTLVEEGLVQACKPGGTGVPFFDSEYAVACKTGTAQQGGEEALPHAWFSAYAPAGKPEMVVTVLVEEAGQGSEVAAPIAKELVDVWMERVGS